MDGPLQSIDWRQWMVHSVVDREYDYPVESPGRRKIEANYMLEKKLNMNKHSSGPESGKQ